MANPDYAFESDLTSGSARAAERGVTPRGGLHFADDRTHEIYLKGSAGATRIPPDFVKTRAEARYVHLAESFGDLKVPFSHRLYEFYGVRLGQPAISINAHRWIWFRLTG